MEQQGSPAPALSDERAALDAVCVRKTLSGDMRAFDELVQQYQRRAVSVAYRLLGNADDAADVTQEAFVRAFRSLGGLEEPERFAAWLMRITCNLALNFRRGRRSHLSLSAGDDPDAVLEQHASETGLVEVMHDPTLTSETKAAIDAAIAGLPEKQRMALILFAIEGLPHKEVADILECSVEAVKWNVFQARKKLKDELADYITE